MIAVSLTYQLVIKFVDLLLNLSINCWVVYRTQPHGHVGRGRRKIQTFNGAEEESKNRI